MTLSVVLILLLVSDTFASPTFLDRVMRKRQRNSLENLPCMYSRYMLHYFNLNGIVFKNKFGVTIDDESDTSASPEELLSALEFYDNQLRSQGKIVLAMLHELRITQISPKPPKVLMQVNLYLNNLSRTTRVNVQEAHTTEPNYVRGYKFFYKKITEALKNKIDRDCYVKKDPIVQDKEYEEPKFEVINKLLAKEWPLKTDGLAEVLLILDHNKIELEKYFQSTFDTGICNDFKPENLLFMSLLEPEVDYLNTVSNIEMSTNLASSSNELSLDTSLFPRNVITEYKINGAYASIYDLFILTRASFDQNNVISFQQHVCAAVLYPFFIRIHTYFRINKKYRGGGKFEVKFVAVGKKLLNTFKSLIELEIFPNDLQNFLNTIFFNFNALETSCTYKWENRVKEMTFISDRILKLMNLYNLKFSIDDKFDIKHDNDAYVNNELKFLESTINNLEVYVQNLKILKPALKKGLAIDSYDGMTKSDPIDIRNTQELGYVVVKNKIDEPLTIQIIITP
ncbi:uncharacterized protein LOC126835759 [Adelges cooleyi]|uniref:uncharacterized protein LOC126835759 n=1 Tax=Adelges cooleyi TaxID=133065 RepID=UPI002180177C|nr:uncharacterized protein LOC126835759 [Adelges cooleyi]